MLFWTYWLITLLVAALTINELFRETDWRRQISAALVLLPLLLRVLLLK